MNIIKGLLIFIAIALFSIPCFCDDKFVLSEIIDKQDYQIRLKQYSQKYPVVLYVVFKESTPLIKEIQKILKEELLIASKNLSNKNIIIASAWFDDQVSDEIEKIELSVKSSAFVWIGDKENKITTFPEYIKFLKDKEKNKI